MSEIKQLALNARYGHATIGSVSAFAGKSFVKDAVGATSCEISYGSLAPGEAVPFLHSHKANEEHYLILSGKGCFQVDDDIFDISEGSVVRVATGLNAVCATRTLTLWCMYASRLPKAG